MVITGFAGVVVQHLTGTSTAFPVPILFLICPCHPLGKHYCLFASSFSARDIRKLIHHRKEILSRRSPTPSSHKQALPSSASDLSLSHTPTLPNGLSRPYGRQASEPIAEPLDRMPGDPGFYQVPQEAPIFFLNSLSLSAVILSVCHKNMEKHSHSSPNLHIKALFDIYLI